MKPHIWIVIAAAGLLALSGCSRNPPPAEPAEEQDYKEVLESALNLEASKQRTRQIRQLLATNLESSPRRRQDIDTVFMLSSRSHEARALKPLIAFLYADDLPVYATSPW